MDKQEKIDALYQTIVSLESIEQCRDLFEDLCTQKELEKMADSMLKESASGKPGKGTLDEKAIASLPAAALLTTHEKLKELFAKGKKKGKLDAGELSEVLDEMDLESDQMDSIYDSLEQLGIEVGTEDFLRRRFDLTAEHIVRAVRAAMARK